MRAFILAAIVAVGVGLGFAPTVNAAPVNGVAIGEGADSNNSVVQVQHWARRSHWRWGSRGGGGGWNRCHARHWSRWYRC
jgi:hypothetical protein